MPPSRSSWNSVWSWRAEAEVEGLFADQCTGLDGVRCDIAMVRTPDGHSRLELAKYRSPAAISAGPRTAAQHPGHAPRDVRRRRHRGRRCPPAPSRRRTRRRDGPVRGQLSALLRPRPGGHHRRTGRATGLRLPRGRASPTLGLTPGAIPPDSRLDPRPDSRPHSHPDDGPHLPPHRTTPIPPSTPLPHGPRRGPHPGDADLGSPGTLCQSPLLTPQLPQGNPRGCPGDRAELDVGGTCIMLRPIGKNGTRRRRRLMGLVVGLVAVSGMVAGQAGAAYAAVGVPKPSTAHADAELRRGGEGRGRPGEHRRHQGAERAQRAEWAGRAEQIKRGRSSAHRTTAPKRATRPVAPPKPDNGPAVSKAAGRAHLAAAAKTAVSRADLPADCSGSLAHRTPSSRAPATRRAGTVTRSPCRTPPTWSSSRPSRPAGTGFRSPWPTRPATTSAAGRRTGSHRRRASRPRPARTPCKC